MSREITVSVLGNPNSGKTTVFNLLTGLNQKVSNYPGITVERKVAKIKLDANVKLQLEDLPGTYSIIPQSIDEQIVSTTILEWIKNPIKRPDAILYVADITNLRRNMFFLTQLLPLDIPIILLLNMIDISPQNIIDNKLLQKNMGIFKVIPFSASKKIGLNTLKESIVSFPTDQIVKHLYMPLSSEYKKIIYPLTTEIAELYAIPDSIAEQLSFSLLCNGKGLGYLNLEQKKINKVLSARALILNNISKDMIHHLKTMEADLRYIYIDELLVSSNYFMVKDIETVSSSEKIDKILTHSFLGPIIYVAILYFIFQSVFTWATIPMNYIDNTISSLGTYIYSIMPEGIFRGLIVDGIITGVGAVIIFLPQIILLMFLMAILEDTGYMTRVTFIMDRFMKKIGLHGKSILPIMTGYACAIPGIIATRTIDSWKERLITILILPLISCSARLPVYTLMISAFIPDVYIYNFINLQGLMMVGMYFLGTITAFILAKVFSKFLSEKSNATFIIELPPYRIPVFKSIFKQVYNRGKLFLVDAGKIIMMISIIIWFLASFPRDNQNVSIIDKSYAGKIGHFIEPIIEPLGFDWKVGIGLITSFAAREVVVSTLSTIYNIQDNENSMINLKQSMKDDINPDSGHHIYTTLVAVSFMIFYVYAAQCMATFAVVRTETNTWKWPLFMIVYMTLLAYIMSFLVYQGGLFLGFT